MIALWKVTHLAAAQSTFHLWKIFAFEEKTAERNRKLQHVLYFGKYKPYHSCDQFHCYTCFYFRNCHGWPAGVNLHLAMRLHFLWNAALVESQWQRRQ